MNHNEDFDISICPYEKCPICDSKVDYSFDEESHWSFVICINSCFAEEFTVYGEYKCHVFDKFITPWFSDGCGGKEYDLERYSKQQQKAFNYYKKDFRYIAELLERM